ncbi:TetR/AcrR family transcriptional regulator [Microbacterium sp. NPDC091313]
MARNDSRRSILADAGISVLASQGARGLTHRAVDAAADVPPGTASNYFRTRRALIDALVARIGERLAPATEVQRELSAREVSRELFADYIRDIVARLTQQRDVAVALIELRLEASRTPEVAAALGAWQRAGFDADVAFNRERGLPGGRAEIALFHYAIDGLMLDRLTTSIDPGTPTDAVVDQLVERLLPPS